MEPCWPLALTETPIKIFLSRNTQSKKKRRQNKTKQPTRNSIRFDKASIPYLVEGLYIKYHSPESIRSIKQSSNSISKSNCFWRSSTVDWEDLKLYWELEKRPHFLRWLKSLSKILLTTERKPGRQQFLAFLPSLNTGTTYEIF